MFIFVLQKRHLQKDMLTTSKKVPNFISHILCCKTYLRSKIRSLKAVTQDRY